MIFVASQYAAIIDTKGKHFFSKRTNDEIHALLSKALLTFIDWPRGFFSFIDFRYSQKLSANSASGKEEPRAQIQPRRQLAPITWKDFENTRPALFIQLAASQFDFIRNAYKEYMAMRWRERVIASAELNSCKSAQLISARDPTVVDDVTALPPGNADYISGNAAMRALEINLSPTALKRLIIAGKLNAIVSRHRGRSVYLIESSSVENLKAELVNSLSLCDVMRLLGLTSKRIKELVENKVLNPLRGPEIDGNSDWRFSAKEVEGILRVLNSKVRRLRRAGNDRAITFNHVLRKLGKVGIKLSTFIQAILNDQVSACGKTGQRGIHGLLFSEREIAHLVWTELRRNIGDVLSISDFAEELGIGQEAVAYLVKKGIVQAEIKENLESFGPLIARSAAEAFNSMYLLPSKLAPELKTSSEALTRLLISAEIKPVSGRKVDGGHIYIFERHAVQSVNLKWLLDEAKQWKAAQIAGASRLNEKEAANFLGITHQVLLDLVRRGILKQDRRLQWYRANKNEGDYPLDKVKGEEQYRLARPFQLVSLLDMLKFNAREFLFLSTSLKSLEVALAESLRNNGDKDELIEAEHKEWLAGELNKLGESCAEIGLELSIMLIEVINQSLITPEYTVGRFISDLKELERRIDHELLSPIFMVIPRSKAEYYEQPELFGPDVAAKFTAAGYDIQEAGNCFATGRYTACVMHLMRVMEAGLRAYGEGLGIMASIRGVQPNWAAVLRVANDEVQRLNANGGAAWVPEKRVFFEELHPHLHAVRIAWRNPSMHLEKKYDDREAERIFRAVKDFMEHLATRLDEAGTFTP